MGDALSVNLRLFSTCGRSLCKFGETGPLLSSRSSALESEARRVMKQEAFPCAALSG